MTAKKYWQNSRPFWEIKRSKSGKTFDLPREKANRMKRMSQSGSLDMDAMFSILEQEKPNQREQIKIQADLVAKYFPEDFTPKQKTDLIEKLLKEWHDKQKHEKKQSPDISKRKAR